MRVASTEPRVDIVVDRSGRSARQAARLEEALSDLEAMDLDALRARWHALTDRAAPTTFRAPLLRAALAYKLQERALGGLKASTSRLLYRVAEAADLARHKDPTGPARPAGQAGQASSDQASSEQAASRPVTAQRRLPALPLRIKPGTRLLRTWQGRTHEVLVGKSSVTYRGQAYRSLSEVACLITGQRWSGPLFFGLKQRAAARPEPSP